ncbi:MAG: [FeFe] hydrogenase H-cluster radical SAM maturase HydE [Acutalibacteraceae bacterium]
MKERIKILIEKLNKTQTLSISEYEELLKNRDDEAYAALADCAVKKRKEFYGNTVYLRGLIEISNICKNDCLYCGIRRSNTNCDRYRLTIDEIIDCADTGYALSMRTFVLQGGEDPYYTDEILCDIIKRLKTNHPDCAVTLSLGERSDESYRLLKEAGADRYLLRHETIAPEYYSRLHPSEMSFHNRIRCLNTLKKLGYQTGCGFMVGAPFQTNEILAKELKFIEEFQPQMCGIGPFIPHKDTPFRDFPSGSVELTCYLLSIIRLIKPNILLPATTALNTVSPDGRRKGILSGANVVMPNLSPSDVRSKYELYNNKAFTGTESAQCIKEIKKDISSIGYEAVTHRGDIIN